MKTFVECPQCKEVACVTKSSFITTIDWTNLYSVCIMKVSLTFPCLGVFRGKHCARSIIFNNNYLFITGSVIKSSSESFLRPF